MPKSTYLLHSEYLYPRVRTKFIVWRAVIISILLIGQCFLFSYLGEGLAEGDYSYLFLIIIFGVFLPAPLFWTIMDTFRKLRRPSEGYKLLVRVVMTHQDIALIAGQFMLRKLAWKDIAYIEKSREVGERVITLVINPLNEKIVKCDESRKNYIEVPCTRTIEAAIHRFSGRHIELHDPEKIRFLR